MKVTIELDATPKEYREFLGLPDVQPLQEEILKEISGRMQQGMAGFDPVSLLRPLLPENLKSLEMWQKAFWNALAGGQPGQTEETGSAAASGKRGKSSN